VAKIAFFQNRLGRTDGVSLEVDKWRRVLTERLGHEVVYCAGNPDVPGHCLPELFASHPVTWRILRNASVAFTDYATPAELEAEIYMHADLIEQRLLDFIASERPDVLVPNNLCSGGFQPAAAVAFHRVIRRTGLPAIVHSHDFYYEDSGEVSATGHVAHSLYERYFPPILPRVQHVVINRIAQRWLAEHKALAATVVPNVFDFEQPAWTQDDYNADLRTMIGVSEDDLVILQATRILDRKGIELAIDMVAQLQQPGRRRTLAGAALVGGGRFREDSRIVLVCAGIVETIGISGGYWPALQARAQRLGVDLLHIGKLVGHSCGRGADGEKIYSLWDTYAHADLVTYPSQWEGWGNQFIEAVFARLPVVVFEYPVWQTDLAPHGFQVISLGDQVKRETTDGLCELPAGRMASAVDEVVSVLTNPDRREAMVAHNAEIGRREFSMAALEGLVRVLLRGAHLPEKL